jgi:hypothetical protein
MARDVVYTYETPIYKVDVIPADAAPLSGSHTIVTLPEGALQLSEPGESKFKDGLPIGVVETGVYKVRARLHLLTGSAHLEDLRKYLVNFSRPGQGSLSFGSGIFALSNLFRIYVNRGGLWVLIFEGCQRLNPEPEYEIEIYRGATLDFELHSSDRVVTELARMEWICEHARGISRTSQFSSFRSSVIDTAWTYGGSRNLWQTGRRYSASFWPLHEIWRSIQLVADDIYCKLARVSSLRGSGIWHFRFRTGATFDAAYGCNPWDYWTFYKQLETTAGLRGSAIDKTAIAVIGEVRYDGASDPIGGLLQPGEGSLMSWTNVYDFLRDATEAGVCRALPVKESSTQLEIHFFPATDIVGPRAGLELEVDDFRAPRGSGRIVKARSASSAIQTVEVSSRGGLGKDQKSWKRTLSGSDADKRYTVKLMFNNMPAVGEHDWANDYAFTVTGTYPGGDPTARWINRLWVWNLYSFQNLWGATGSDPVRVHSAVTFPNTVHSFAWGLDAPELSVQTSDVPGVRLKFAAWQNLSGMATAIQEELEVLASDRQTTYDITIEFPFSETQTIDTYNVGSPAMLPLDGNGLSTAYALINPNEEFYYPDESYLPLFGKGVLTSVRVNPFTRKTAVKLFGMTR